MAALSEAEVSACIHPRQIPRFWLALLFCLALLPLLAALAVLGAISLILPWLVFLVWIAYETMFAYYKGNSILVSETNYPRIHGLTEELKQTLGIDKTVYVFVFEQGYFNAYFMRFFFRRAIFLNSEILEAGVSDDEVRWIVGRFVGYLRAQKRAGPAGWLIRMTQRIGITSPLLLPYDRAMVYTGDRLALASIGGDISTALSAMQKLFVGRQLGYSVNPVGLVEQHRTIKGSLFGFWARLGSPFPHTTARYVDLLAFSKRQYPDAFARFETANPGLATDIDMLSSEYADGGALLKGIGAYLGLMLLVILSLAVFSVAFSPLLARMAAPPPEPSYDTTPSDTSDTNTVPQEPDADSNSASSGSGGDAPAAPAAAPADQPADQPDAQPAPAPANPGDSQPAQSSGQDQSSDQQTGSSSN